jgi:hypothetical protein
MLNIKPKIFKKSFYNTFLGSLIKNGDLVSLKVLLDQAFNAVLKITEIPFHLIFFKIILLLNTSVEVKQIKKYKKLNCNVPFSYYAKKKPFSFCQIENQVSFRRQTKTNTVFSIVFYKNFLKQHVLKSKNPCLKFFH